MTRHCHGSKKRATVLAIWYLGKILLQKPKGHGACDLGLGRDSFQNSRGTMLAIECLGRIFKKNYGARRLRFGIREGLVSKGN